MNIIEIILGFFGLCFIGLILYGIFLLILFIIASLPVIGIFATGMLQLLGFKK